MSGQNQRYSQYREKKCINITVFDYENKEKIPSLRFKKYFQKTCFLLLIEEKDRFHSGLVKNFNTFM